MARSHLKLYAGPELDRPVPAQASQEGQVKLSFGDIYPLLLDAVQNERTWLRDFEDESITISEDLYDVLLAYQHFRPSA